VVSIAGTLIAAGVCQAQWADVTKIEEDWELVIGTPDAGVAAPQTTCTIAPAGNLNGLHATLELNLRSQPSFSPGGVSTPTLERRATPRDQDLRKLFSPVHCERNDHVDASRSQKRREPDL
jgi:hypothetical protein